MALSGILLYTKRKKGIWLVKKLESTRIEASGIASDPAFQRTHQNGSEFGRAGKPGNILKTALRSILSNSDCGRMVCRLTQQMIKVIQAGVISIRGLQNVFLFEALFINQFFFVNDICFCSFSPYIGIIHGWYIN